MASNEPSPPPGEDPSPAEVKKEVERDAQMVGKKFIIKYYQTLSKEPSHLHKFYKGASQLTRGSGSSPVDPVLGPVAIREALSEAGLADAQVDLEDGSLDAQDSHGGGVLIVVTGRMTLVADGDPCTRPFVHTFFLTREVSGGGKKHFYVLNDIFRFMGDQPSAPPPPSPPSPRVEKLIPDVIPSTPIRAVPVLAPVPSPVAVVAPSPEPEPVIVPPPTPPPPTPPPPTPPRRVRPPAPKPVPVVAPLPEIGVEESKGEDDIPPTIDADDAADAEIDGGLPSPPAAPGTWASKLFSAGGGGNGAFSSPRGGGRRSALQAQSSGGFDGKSPGGDTVTPATRAEKPPGGRSSAGGGPKRRGTSKGKEARGADEENKVERVDTRTGSKGRAKRVEPDRERNGDGGRNNKNGAASLYIKNLQEGITEEAVKLLFGRFGKVVGITVNAGRGFAFVDYADVSSVATALTDKSLLVINGLKLDAQAKNASRAMRDAGGRGSYAGGGATGPGPRGGGGRRLPTDNGEDVESGAGTRKGDGRGKGRDGSGDREKRERRRPGRGNGGSGDRRGKNGPGSAAGNGTGPRVPVGPSE